ncbi:MAG TPA: DNA replication and repair protein RecF [Acidimicrobiales bacterium]|nr:DNA replication and repair protein RecF [Acidimicrobiales bacterium]
MTAITPAQGAGTRLRRLELHDVRLFAEACLDVDPDAATVLTGPNGSGKTTVLEAVAYLGSQRSFRTTARDAMVRTGRERGIVRAQLERDARPLLVESEVRASGATRTLVNHRTVHGRAELADTVPVTVFTPGDLALVQGPPARRRELVDASLRLVDHRVAAELDAMDRVLRQRAALLRQAGGRLGADVASTLDVWDERLAAAGSVVADARRALLAEAGTLVDEAYAALASAPSGRRVVTMTYVPGWDGPLADALAKSRRDDVRRAASTVGPHRDEVVLCIDDREARVRASQGEQRSLALALRLGLHRLVTSRRGDPPLLLLDDVFSELDPDRSRAVVRHLPHGQALLTTATAIPGGIDVGAAVDVRDVGRRA